MKNLYYFVTVMCVRDVRMNLSGNYIWQKTNKKKLQKKIIFTNFKMRGKKRKIQTTNKNPFTCLRTQIENRQKMKIF